MNVDAALLSEVVESDPGVTKSTADIQHVVGDGFKIEFGNVDNGAGAFEMMHGNYFVVVDGQMGIRGYYTADKADKADEIDRLVRDVVSLAIGEGGRGGCCRTGNRRRATARRSQTSAA